MAGIDQVMKPKTHVAILLDKSSSMGSISTYAVKTFNDQLETLLKQSEDQDLTVTLTNFSHLIETVKYREPAQSVESLLSEQYRPHGTTALNDAIGTTVQKLMAETCANDPNTSFLIIVISDGMENASTKFTKEQISSMIKELEDTKRWTFTYLGANTTRERVVQDYGISQDNIMLFSADAQGMTTGSMVTARATDLYLNSRAAGKTYTTSFYSPS
jgi:Mg-chelatase subunit ChlD